MRFLLEQGEKVNSTDSEGRTPLILSTLIEDEKWALGLARLLIEYGASISRRDKLGYNALHYACMQEKTLLMNLLLQSLDGDIHSRCYKGNTCLHYAAILGNISIIQLLVSLLIKYRISLDPKNKYGMTPLHQAWKSDNINCGDFLVEKGADQMIRDPSTKQTASELRQVALSKPADPKGKPADTKQEIARILGKIAMILPAKAFDRRNDPTYVFNISGIEYFRQRRPTGIVRAKTVPPGSWRDNIASLWTQYESQCSRAFRKPAVADPELEASNSLTRNSVPPLNRRASRLSMSKSRTNSVSSDTPRRQSVTRRPGMPPLVRTQSRASFALNG